MPVAGTFIVQLGFDPRALARARQMEGFASWLAASLRDEAMPASLDDLEQAAQAVMLSSFQNPSGKVETRFRKFVSSPYKGILSNYVRYAQRLNYGFSGMTDALGRYYPYWPAYHWAEQAVELAALDVQEHFTEAVHQAIREVL